MRVVLLVVAVLGFTLLPPAVRGVLSWVLVGYLVWRAWPAIRADLGRVPALRSLRRPRIRGKFESGRL